MTACRLPDTTRCFASLIYLDYRSANLRFDIGEIAILMKLSVSNLFATINNILKIYLYIFIGSTEILMVKLFYIRNTEAPDFTNFQN